MNRPFLRLIARSAIRAPWVMIFVTVSLVVVSLFGILRLHIATDVIELLPHHSPVVATLQRVLKEFKALDYMLVVLEASEPRRHQELIEAGEEMSRLLRNPEFVFSVDYKLDEELRDFFLQQGEGRFVSLLTQEDWDQIREIFEEEELRQRLVMLERKLVGAGSAVGGEKILRDPLGIGRIIQRRLSYTRGPTKLDLRRGYFLSQNGQYLIMVLKPLESSSDISFTRKFNHFLQDCRRAFYRRNPGLQGQIKVGYLGSHYETYEQSRLVQKDLLVTLFTSFILVITLYILIFHSLESLYIVGLPLIVGILWTLGLTGFCFGRLTLVTFAFGAVLIGLGIDFAIHLYNRFVEEVQRGRGFERALECSLTETGGSIMLGAITTAAAFYCMLITSFEGFRELGMVAGNGILCCLAAIFMILPPILVIKNNLNPQTWRQVQVSSLGLNWLSGSVLNYPRVLLILGVIVTVYLGFNAINLRFNENLKELKETSPEYEELREKVGRHFALPANQLIVVVSGNSLQDALQRNDRLYEGLMELREEFGLLSWDSLRTLLPSVRSQRWAHEMVLSLNLDEIEKTIIATAQEAGLTATALEPFLQRLRDLQEQARKGEVLRYGKINSPQYSRYVLRQLWHQGGQYRIITYIYPRQESWTEERTNQLVSELEERVGPIEVSGISILTQELQSIIKYDLALVVLVAIMVVFLLLFFYFRNTLKALMAMIPVGCGSIWMLGTMTLLGLEMNFLNITVVPMIIGIGVDDGIHLINRFYERGQRDWRAAVERTGRAVVVTSLTTILGFGSLSLASFYGIRQIGLLCIIGVGYCLLVTLFVLAPMLRIWEKRESLAELVFMEEGELR